MAEQAQPQDLADDEADDYADAYGLTAADYAKAAEEAYAHRDEFDSLEEVEFEIDPNVRSVVSVRFRPGELGPIDEAARALGVPFSTFIRNAAINAAVALDIEEAKRAATAARDNLDRLLRALEGTAPAAPAPSAEAPRRARATKAAKPADPAATEPPKRRRKAA